MEDDPRLSILEVGLKQLGPEGAKRALKYAEKRPFRIVTGKQNT